MTSAHRRRDEGRAPADGTGLSAGRERAPVSVLGRAFSILEAFDVGSETVGLSELSVRTGLPKATVYRLAQELAALGALRRVNRGYSLGFGLLGLGRRVGPSAKLRLAACPVIVDVCAATSATVSLTVRDRDESYVIERLSGTRAVHDDLAHVGARLPLTCSAPGRLLLALGVDEDHVPVDGDAPAGRGPCCTPGTPHDLLPQLSEIRARHVAVDRSTAPSGATSFAVPVLDATRSVVAALSATVPARYEAEDRLVDHLRGASAMITRRLQRMSGSRPQDTTSGPWTD